MLRWMLVWARSDDADPLVGSFLVEAGTPGVRIVETWDSLGMRATRSDDVVFEDASIPLEHAVDVVAGQRAAADRGADGVRGVERRADRGDLPRRRPGRPGLARPLPQRAGPVEPRRPAGLAAPLPGVVRPHRRPARARRRAAP